MSITKRTTKVATFKTFLFTNGEEIWADTISNNNCGNCIGAETSAGIVSGTNSFTTAIPGDKVVLRANAPRSYDADTPRKWVMTNLA